MSEIYYLKNEKLKIMIDIGKGWNKGDRRQKHLSNIDETNDYRYMISHILNFFENDISYEIDEIRNKPLAYVGRIQGDDVGLTLNELHTIAEAFNIIDDLNVVMTRSRLFVYLLMNEIEQGGWGDWELVSEYDDDFNTDGYIVLGDIYEEVEE